MKRIYLIMFLLGALISCDKKEETIIPNIATYPVSVGSQWTYERQMIFNKFESKTSNKIVGTDTYNFVSKVWVDKDTVLNGKNVVKFIANDENWNHVQFKFIDTEGLKTYAYIDAGLNVFAKGGIYFKSATLDILSAGDRIFYEQTPTMDIKLPLQTGSQWTFRGPTEFSSLKIEKKVTGTETLKLAGQHFDCYKIEYLFSSEASSNHVKMTDWISDKGLIKRITVVKDVTMQNENGDQLVYGQSIETLTLKEVDIK